MAKHPPIDNRNYCRKCGKLGMKSMSGYWLCADPSCGHRFYGNFNTDPYTDCQGCGTTYPINARICPNCGLNGRSDA